MDIPQKLKIDILHDTFLGIYPKECKSMNKINNCKIDQRCLSSTVHSSQVLEAA
jgi:hypothetical protein